MKTGGLKNVETKNSCISMHLSSCEYFGRGNNILAQLEIKSFAQLKRLILQERINLESLLE